MKMDEEKIEQLIDDHYVYHDEILKILLKINHPIVALSVIAEAKESVICALHISTNKSCEDLEKKFDEMYQKFKVLNNTDKL